MRSRGGKGLTTRRSAAGAVALLLLAPIACGDETEAGPDRAVVKSAAPVRAARRAFDGAPPVIPHQQFGAACTSCHHARGVQVADVGFAPPAPHAHAGERYGAMSRCQQCHVFAQTDALFRDNSFAGIAQDLRRGERLNPLAPPVIPHQVLLRENCAACHTGAAAREQIRCPHPERVRCRQCHVEQVTSATFRRPAAR